MLLDLNDYDLIKSITRSEAKKVHKDLPPGGAWRTMNGHHIYIKNGKVLAGAVPGVAKAKKATKTQLAEHQATIDKEAKKSSKKTPTASKKGAKANEKSTKAVQTKSKTTPTGKGSSSHGHPSSGNTCTSPRGSKSGTEKGTKSKIDKQKAFIKAGIDQMQTEKEALLAKEKADKKAKLPKLIVDTKKELDKLANATKPKPKSFDEHMRDTKQAMDELFGDAQGLKELASKSTDGMDMFMNAQEDPKTLKALRGKLANMQGSTSEKLVKLYKELGGGKSIEEYAKDSTKALDDFTLGKPSVKPSDVKVTTRSDGRSALASAPTGAEISIHKDFGKNDKEMQEHVLAHESGHILSNAYQGLASHILDNPQGAFGKTNRKHSRFEGNFGTFSPEESFAESYGVYMTNPQELKKRYPKAYAFMQELEKKIPSHADYLNQARKQVGHLGELEKSLQEIRALMAWKGEDL